MEKTTSTSWQSDKDADENSINCIGFEGCALSVTHKCAAVPTTTTL
jgi:sulfite reductase beta subunit-like hemoprotein